MGSILVARGLHEGVFLLSLEREETEGSQVNLEEERPIAKKEQQK